MSRAAKGGIRVERLPDGRCSVTLMAGAMVAATTLSAARYRELTNEVLSVVLDELDDARRAEARRVMDFLLNKEGSNE